MDADYYNVRMFSGFGNWGSVWRCHPKQDADPEKASFRPYLLSVQHTHVFAREQVVAIKLVHRQKTCTTTSARIRSLWSEYKVLRTFRTDPHPNIVRFTDFVVSITVAESFGGMRLTAPLPPCRSLPAMRSSFRM